MVSKVMCRGTMCLWFDTDHLCPGLSVIYLVQICWKLSTDPVVAYLEYTMQRIFPGSQYLKEVL